MLISELYCSGFGTLGHTPSVVKHSISKQIKHLIHGMGDVHPTEEKIKYEGGTLREK